MSDPNPPKPGHDNADPSMDDILASIRRILSEDGTPASAPDAPAVPAPAPASDVLALDESMIVREPPAAPPPPSSSLDDDDFSPPPLAAAPPPAPLRTPFHVEEVAPPPPPPPPHPVVEREIVPLTPHADQEGLVGPAAAAATASAMGSLLQQIAAERSMAIHRGGPTIEDIVREEMRPLLKAWLDTHLPPVVERLVRAEIERVVNRAVP